MARNPLHLPPARQEPHDQLRRGDHHGPGDRRRDRRLLDHRWPDAARRLLRGSRAPGRPAAHQPVGHGAEGRQRPRARLRGLARPAAELRSPDRLPQRHRQPARHSAGRPGASPALQRRLGVARLPRPAPRRSAARARLRAHRPAAGADPVVLIGYQVWQQDYGGAADVVGRTVRVNARPTTVVGVLPRDFRFPEQPGRLAAPGPRSPRAPARRGATPAGDRTAEGRGAAHARGAGDVDHRPASRRGVSGDQRGHGHRDPLVRRPRRQLLHGRRRLADARGDVRRPGALRAAHRLRQRHQSPPRARRGARPGAGDPQRPRLGAAAHGEPGADGGGHPGPGGSRRSASSWRTWRCAPSTSPCQRWRSCRTG